MPNWNLGVLGITRKLVKDGIQLQWWHFEKIKTLLPISYPNSK
jgi:hypothetical protein